MQWQALSMHTKGGNAVAGAQHARKVKEQKDKKAQLDRGKWDRTRGNTLVSTEGPTGWIRWWDLDIGKYYSELYASHVITG